MIIEIFLIVELIIIALLVYSKNNKIRDTIAKIGKVFFTFLWVGCICAGIFIFVDVVITQGLQVLQKKYDIVGTINNFEIPKLYKCSSAECDCNKK